MTRLPNASAWREEPRWSVAVGSRPSALWSLQIRSCAGYVSSSPASGPSKKSPIALSKKIGRDNTGTILALIATQKRVLSQTAPQKREEIADELMITEKKVLEVRYRNQNNEEGLIYAEEKQIGSEAITLRECKVAHGIKCGITGKIEFYAQPEQEKVIPRGWITSILEIEQPSWWNSNREEVLRDLVWLKAEPALQTNSKKKADALLAKLIAQRRRRWEDATVVASEVENTFFRGLAKPNGNANAQVLQERLQRVWSFLTASDLEALKQTGLPGLGTNHPHNQQLREWLKKLPNRQAEPANEKQPA